jgi:ATP cone domain
MKRRVEFLVEKRDGRREWLRATKLARSIHLALQSAGVDEDWRALEVASTVLLGLRRRRADDPMAGCGVLTTTEIADAVQHVLVVTGQPVAAAAYGAVSAERGRRRRALEALSAAAQHRKLAVTGDTLPLRHHRRLPQE